MPASDFTCPPPPYREGGLILSRRQHTRLSWSLSQDRQQRVVRLAHRQHGFMAVAPVRVVLHAQLPVPNSDRRVRLRQRRGRFGPPTPARCGVADGGTYGGFQIGVEIDLPQEPAQVRQRNFADPLSTVLAE